MECFLISPLNYIQNTNFPLFSFLKYRDFRLFVISIFVVVKENVVNSKYIFVLFLVFFFLSFFVIFRASLSELQYLCFSLFVLQFQIYLSIYLPAIYLPICLYEVICPSFLKAVLPVETVPFIKTVYREVQIQKKALYKLYWAV